MTDDRVIRLLEEVRDLQREHLGHYKEALRNQAESIRMQRELSEAAKSRLRIVSVLIAIVVVLLIVSAWGV
ncbi:MAG TPA: hypothetical protein VK845_14200, partial [Gemmatimonadales bacterium]|nr:hypothetical protein [Gemmatimonadales bacterium]